MQYASSLHHAAEPANLSLDARQPSQDRLLVLEVAGGGGLAHAPEYIRGGGITMPVAGFSDPWRSNLGHGGRVRC